MKLNPDCIRDVLLTFEPITDGRCTHIISSWEDFTDHETFPLLKPYSEDEIEYHIRQCDLSRMFVGAQFPCDGGFIVRDLSPSAHEFLANIRSDTNWKETKNILSKAGTFALSMVQSVAAGVAQAAIKSQLGLK